MFTEEVMMFHKQYYKLEEAAQKLGVDVETILSMEFEGSITLSYVHIPNLEDENDYCIEVVIEYDETVYRENIIKAFSEKYLIEDFVFNDVVDIVHQKITEVCEREPYKDKVIEAIKKVIDGTIDDTFLLYTALCESKDDLGSHLNCFLAKEHLDPYTPYQLSRPHVQRVIHEDGSVMILGYIIELGDVVDEQVSQRPSKGLVITHTELTRLLALKAEHDGKTTAEQLQQQLDEANARIAELEAMQAEPAPDNQPTESQQPYPCLQPIANIIEAFEHNPDFVKYGQGIQQQIIENWLRVEHKQTVHESRHIKALITAHYNITT